MEETMTPSRRTLMRGALAAAALLAMPAHLRGQGRTQVKLGIGTTEAEESLSRSFNALKAYAEARSGGAIEMRLFWNTLGGSLQLSQQVREGTLEMSLTDDAVMTGFHRPIMALQIPYLLDSAAVAWEFMREAALWQVCEEMRRATGIRTLVFSENGFRNITNNVRPIRTPEDMRGIRMRTLQSPVYIEFMRSMGASATPIPFPELVLALRQGVVDGQENANGAILDNRLNEVQRHLSTNEHVYGFHMVIANDRWFAGIPLEHRRILTEACHLHAQTANSWRARDALLAVGTLRERGMQVHITTAEQKEQFRRVTQQPVIAYITSQIGEDNVKRITDAATSARQRVYGA
jgi:TRAP-type transport system periplasmic protein